jgi:hypothetical protein
MGRTSRAGVFRAGLTHMLDSVLMVVVGVVFVAGGAYLSYCSLGAKNMIESAMFGLMGVTVGLFLIATAFFGPPNY